MANPKKERFHATAERILAEVGGKENVASVQHCMTRLRFNLKDESISDTEAIKRIPGVAGVMASGSEYQVIIGLEVGEVYAELCDIGGFQKSTTISENLDPKATTTRTRITPAGVGSALLNALSGSLTPLIPVIMAASLVRLIGMLLGPQMLGLLPETHDFIVLCTFVADAGFYFLPFIVGYTAAKYAGLTPVLGIFMAGVFMHPTMMQMAADGTPFTVFGIPAAPQNYSTTIFPILLSVWFMSYVEKLVNRYLPALLRTVLGGLITVLITLPVALCALGPLGGFLGTLLNDGLLGLAGSGGLGAVLATAIIGALWQLLVLTGMHHALIAALVAFFASNGQEGVIMPGLLAAGVSVYGMVFGFLLRVKDPEERSLCVGYLTAGLLGGVTEPSMYGVGIKYRRPMIGMILGGLVGGLLHAILGVKVYTFVPIANFFLFANYAGGPTSNLVLGVIVVIATMLAAAAITYFFGFKKDDPLLRKPAAAQPDTAKVG